MELDEAMKIISEIAEGDKEREAFETVKAAIVGLCNDCEAYRSLYEGSQKRLTQLRDVARRPDIYENQAAGLGEDEKRVVSA